jgi:hypothetical protein
VLTYSPIHFYEQAKHIRGSGQILLFLCHPQESFINFGKHIGAKGVYSSANRKQRGPQRNFVDIYPINVISPICFHLKNVGNRVIIISKKSFETKKLEEFLIFT